MRHVYPIKESLKHVYNTLKTSDAVVHQSMRALGFEPVLYLYYDEDGKETVDKIQGAIVDKLIYFDDDYNEQTILGIAQREGGFLVCQDGVERDGKSKDTEPVEWITQLTTFNRQEGAYGNEPTLNWAYGDMWMIVRIENADDRWAYPRVTQVKRAYR